MLGIAVWCEAGGNELQLVSAEPISQTLRQPPAGITQIGPELYLILSSISSTRLVIQMV